MLVPHLQKYLCSQTWLVAKIIPPTILKHSIPCWRHPTLSQMSKLCITYYLLLHTPHSAELFAKTFGIQLLLTTLIRGYHAIDQKRYQKGVDLLIQTTAVKEWHDDILLLLHKAGEWQLALLYCDAVSPPLDQALYCEIALRAGFSHAMDIAGCEKSLFHHILDCCFKKGENISQIATFPFSSEQEQVFIEYCSAHMEKASHCLLLYFIIHYRYAQAVQLADAMPDLDNTESIIIENMRLSLPGVTRQVITDVQQDSSNTLNATFVKPPEIPTKETPLKPAVESPIFLQPALPIEKPLNHSPNAASAFSGIQSARKSTTPRTESPLAAHSGRKSGPRNSPSAFAVVQAASRKSVTPSSLSVQTPRGESPRVESLKVATQAESMHSLRADPPYTPMIESAQSSRLNSPTPNFGSFADADLTTSLVESPSLSFLQPKSPLAESVSYPAVEQTPVQMNAVTRISPAVEKRTSPKPAPTQSSPSYPLLQSKSPFSKPPKETGPRPKPSPTPMTGTFLT